MSNCIGKTVASKVRYNKIVKDTAEVAFTVMEDIDACAKIITKKYESLTNDKTTAVFYKSQVPEDLLNICESFGCKNTGTLNVHPIGSTTGMEKSAGVVFTSASDATEYMAGVLLFYVGSATEDHTYTVEIADIKDEEFTNADSYSVSVKANTSAQFAPVTIDLSKTPTKTIGEGWQASDNGVRLRITVDSYVMLISSISFFDSIEDLEGNEAIRLGCLTGVDGEDTIDALEESCMSAQYDETSPSIERTITFKTWTPNAVLLNPFMHKSDETEGWFFQTVKKTVPSYENGKARIHLSDLYTEECGHVYVAIDDSCNTTDSVLHRVNSPNELTLNENQFQVITAKQSPDRGDLIGGEIVFDGSLSGKTVVISYPKEALEVETYHATTVGVNDRRVKMAYTKTISDGVVEMYEYKNVLVTSFPMALSDSDSELEMTISVQKDNNNDYYTMKRINSEAYLL